MDLHPYYETLRATTLLRAMPDQTLDVLLPRLDARTQRYAAGAFVLLAGYPAPGVGIVLKGHVTACKTTAGGDSVTVTHLGPAGLFGDVLCAAGAKSPVTLQADTEALVLYLPYERIIRPPVADDAHWQLLQNLVTTIGGKYLGLDRRLDLLICKSLRTRIALWLLDQAQAAGSDTFTVPLTRAALAAYLNCDRSALSRELGRMQREGLLETWRGSFRLRDKDRLTRLAHSLPAV